MDIKTKIIGAEQEIRSRRTYITREGKLATILDVGARGCFPVIGCVKEPAHDRLRRWTSTGRSYVPGRADNGEHGDGGRDDLVKEIVSGEESDQLDVSRVRRLERDIAVDTAKALIEGLVPSRVRREKLFGDEKIYWLGETDPRHRSEVDRAFEYLFLMRIIEWLNEDDASFVFLKTGGKQSKVDAASAAGIGLPKEVRSAINVAEHRLAVTREKDRILEARRMIGHLIEQGLSQEDALNKFYENDI